MCFYANSFCANVRPVFSPKPEKRVALCIEHLRANVEMRGEPFGVRVTRRHLSGYLHGLPGAADLRRRLNTCDSLDGCLEMLEESKRRAA